MKKVITWIIVIVVILALVLGILWFFASKNTQAGTDGAFQTVLNLFPKWGDNVDVTPITPIVIPDDVTPTSTDANTPIPRIRQISPNPVAGFGIFTASSSTSTIRYIQRADGNIFEAYSDNLVLNRITNKTITNIIEAAWLNSTSSAIILTSGQDDVVRAYLLTIPFATASNTPLNEVGTSYITQYVENMTVSPTKDRVALMSKGSIMTVDKVGKITNAYTSAFRTWHIAWPTLTTFALYPKPSAAAVGHLYTYTIGQSSLNKIVGDAIGLSGIINPTGTKSFVTRFQNRVITSHIVDSATKEEVSIPLATFTEKCAWSDSITIICGVPIAFLDERTYPDDWYMGKTSTIDNLWAIDAVTGRTTLLTNFKEIKNQNFDITAVQVSSDKKYVFFVNKRDFTLWSVRLTEE